MFGVCFKCFKTNLQPYLSIHNHTHIHTSLNYCVSVCYSLRVTVCVYAGIGLFTFKTNHTLGCQDRQHPDRQQGACSQNPNLFVCARVSAYSCDIVARVSHNIMQVLDVCMPTDRHTCGHAVGAGYVHHPGWLGLITCTYIHIQHTVCLVLRTYSHTHAYCSRSRPWSSRWSTLAPLSTTARGTLLSSEPCTTGTHTVIKLHACLCVFTRKIKCLHKSTWHPLLVENVRYTYLVCGVLARIMWHKL